MRELTFVDPTRLVKFNETDSQKVDSLVMMMENVGWNPNLPCVVINRADALFAINCSHRIDAAIEMEIEVPCYIVDNEELGEYDWDSISDASDFLYIMRQTGLEGLYGDPAYVALDHHIMCENMS
jgi:hypothetical protein